MSSLELLWLTEVDESGRITSGVAFDIDDRRAAQREVMARTIAGDAVAAAAMRPTLEFTEGFNDHDRARMRAVLADDIVVVDHRRPGLGQVEGADAYVDSIAVLWDLASDIQVEPVGSELTHERYGVVSGARHFGTLAEGGAFESYYVVMTIVACDRISRIEFFELDDVDAALARFAELRPDPLRIPPNAAMRAGDRLLEAFEARDWDAFGAWCSPGFVFDDRRRFILLTGDRDMFVANGRWIASQASSTSTRTLLATAGDRLALEHFRFVGAPDAPDAEVEVLILREIDAEGRGVAVIAFDPDDRRAASAELLDRYARSDASRWASRAIEFRRALIDRDLDRIRAALPDDFVFHDHRRTGPGRIDGADDYVRWVATLFEQSPDAIIETMYHVAEAAHGALTVGHTFGTLPEGGAFEFFPVTLALFRGNQFVGCEVFELEDLDAARARFEGLRPKRSP